MPPPVLMVLIGTLAAAAAGLSALALRQHLRSAACARAAHEAGLRFSAQDAFDVPHRCASFALCSAGHSAQAANMTYGRVGGLPVRAFDFRYEAGHGTWRTTRRYFVVLVEEPAGPGVLMWNRHDAAGAPCGPARLPEGDVGEWSYRGDAERARRLGELAGSLAPVGVSLEARGEGLMLCFPPRKVRGQPDWLDAIAPIIVGLWPAAGGGAEKARGEPSPQTTTRACQDRSSPDEKGPPQAVANRPRS